MKLTLAGERGLIQAMLAQPSRYLGLMGSNGMELKSPGYARQPLQGATVSEDAVLFAPVTFGPALRTPWQVTAVALYIAAEGTAPWAVDDDPEVACVTEPGQVYGYVLEVRTH